VLVLTYRDAELASGHPLQQLAWPPVRRGCGG
jgi:hypothetical protein